MRMIKYILATLLLFAVWSCRSVQYVPVETVKHDSVYLNKTSVDSVYFRDSIFVHQKGDTVTIVKETTKYKVSVRTDTCVVWKTDTIMKPYAVERELSRWQKLKMDAGGIAMIALFIGLCFFLIKFFVRR